MRVSTTQFLNILLRISFRNLFRNKRRSILTLLALAAGIWSSVTLAAIARGLSHQLAKDAIWNLTGHVQVHAVGFRDDPVAELSLAGNEAESVTTELKKRSSLVAERVRLPGIVTSERESYGVSILGIDPNEEKGLSFIGDGVAQGRMLDSDKDEGIVIGIRLASLLQTSIGKRIVVVGQGSDGKISERGFRIIGLFDSELESTEKSYIFMGRSVAQQLFRLGENISEVAMMLPSEKEAQGVRDELRHLLPSLDVASWEDLEPLVVALLSIQGGFLKLWFFVVVIAVSFGLINTLFMAIFERIREIGLVQALGMRPAGIVIQIVLESFLLIMFGMILGNALTFGTLQYLNEGLDISNFSRGAQMVGIRSIVVPHLRWDDFILANSLVAVIGLLGSLYPAFRASRYTPVQALSRGAVG